MDCRAGADILQALQSLRSVRVPQSMAQISDQQHAQSWHLPTSRLNASLGWPVLNRSASPSTIASSTFLKRAI